MAKHLLHCGRNFVIVIEVVEIFYKERGIAMAGIDGLTGLNGLEGTLYYQWLINNNSTSTMLNAISGTDSVGGIGGLGSLGGTGSVGDLGGSFFNILQSYMTGVNAQDSINTASVADKLSGLLEEAAQTEEKDSLAYKTVQELYQYFSDQVLARASSLLGGGSSSKTADSSGTSASASGVNLDAVNEKIQSGHEVDFSEIDAAVEGAFAESMPMY